MSAVMMADAAAPVRAGGEFLTLRLGDEEYGVDILKVQEIRGYENVTKIANAPEHVKGVINLRGMIVPIIDMRLKFHLAQATYDQFTVVIILNIGPRVVGIVVDGVSDVVALNDAQIKPAPALDGAMNIDYILGLGAVDGRMIILADVEKLLHADELGLLQAA